MVVDNNNPKVANININIAEISFLSFVIMEYNDNKNKIKLMFLYVEFMKVVVLKNCANAVFKHSIAWGIILLGVICDVL